MAGPVAGSADEGEVVLGIVPRIRWGRSPSLAGNAEHQSGAVGDVGGAQVAAEGDGAAGSMSTAVTAARRPPSSAGTVSASTMSCWPFTALPSGGDPVRGSASTMRTIVTTVLQEQQDSDWVHTP